MPDRKLALTPSQIGRLLRAAREDAGLTQAQAAATVAMDAGNLSRLERGLHEPSRATLIVLAGVYGKPLAYFGIKEESLGNVPRGTPNTRAGRSPGRVSEPRPELPATRELVRPADSPRHLTNLPLEIRVFLDEFRLRLTKAHATEEEVERSMALLRSPDLFSWYGTGEPKALEPAKVLKTMKAIAEHVIIPELRERGRKL